LLQEAGEFPSQHAFNLWFQKVAPPDAVLTPDQRREDEAQRVESLLGGMLGLSHAAYEKLNNGVTKLRMERFDRDLEALRKL
jgi:hypothetical protein